MADEIPDRPALFVADGPHLLPTELARGPWDPRALHGGPTAALVVRAAEGHWDAGFAVARLTLELLRPVPLAPLAVSATTVRPGRKVTLVGVEITAGETAVARGLVLGIRRAAPGAPMRELPPPPAPSTVPEAGRPEGEQRAFHRDGVEMRFVEGAFMSRGPATVWIRLRVPVVDGEQPTGAMRAAAAADFGNGVSSELEMGPWLFINPDLSVHLAREPEGEWIALVARTVLGDAGAAVAESSLADQRGVVGGAVQSLLVEPA